MFLDAMIYAYIKRNKVHTRSQELDSTNNFTSFLRSEFRNDWLQINLSLEASRLQPIGASGPGDVFPPSLPDCGPAYTKNIYF